MSQILEVVNYQVLGHISLYALLVTTVGLLLRSIIRKNAKIHIPLKEKDDHFLTSTDNADAYSNIEALLDFDWRKTEPVQLRPFKPRYHLTMAIENTTISDLVLMDNTYVERIDLRRKLMEEHTTANILANNIAGPSINEFYKWMMETYLPQRFPTIFKLETISSSKDAVRVLKNIPTGETIDLTPPSILEDALRTISSHVDNDFFFLIPSSDGKYVLQGYINCFPSGFDSRKKIGLKLADIHTPVPKYAEKLEKSMDRFFNTLPVGKVVKRANWSITTHSRLFVLDGNHLYDGQEAKKDEIDVDKCVLRCERQTLHRLPETGTVVFGFKTYTYPISKIKEEGNGEALCEAIDGLSLGNVPEMAFYKRQVEWGNPVKEYLRS